MPHKVVGAVSTGSSAGAQELLGAVLAPLFRLLAASGVAIDEIQAAVDSSLDSLRPAPAPVTSPVHLGSQQRDCMEILCLWRRQPEFMTKRGTPASLDFSGFGPTFTSLCERAKVTNSPASLLETLLRFDSVSVDEAGRIEPKTPTFILGASNVSATLAIDGILKQLAGFVRVIEHNVLRVAHGNSSRFERACSVVVAEELVPIAHRVVRERGQEFIDGIDEWLERQREVPSPSGRYVEIGAGAYLLELGSRSF